MLTLLSTVLAQEATQINISPAGTEFANLANITMSSMVSALISLIMVLAALVFFFMLVWGGVSYITSGGDKTQTEAARGRITAALIGLVIVFAAWAIVTLVEALFGVSITNLQIEPAS